MGAHAFGNVGDGLAHHQRQVEGCGHDPGDDAKHQAFAKPRVARPRHRVRLDLLPHVAGKRAHQHAGKHDDVGRGDFQ